MNAEELAAEFDSYARNGLLLSETATSTSIEYRATVKASSHTWADAALLIRTHLCTPSPINDAAPDILAVMPCPFSATLS